MATLLRRCCKCNGFGLIKIEPFNLVVRCPNCDGSRLEPKSFREQLEEVGISSEMIEKILKGEKIQ